MNFIVGKSYWASDRGMGSVKVVKKTPCFIYVENIDGLQWRMRIRHDRNGNEFVIDSVLPQKWRDAFIYSADDIDDREEC